MVNKNKNKSAYSLVEEVAAIIKFQFMEDEESKSILFAQYSNLVHMHAHRIYGKSMKSSITFNDLVSEGFIGLLVAMKKHNVFRCDKMYPTANFYIIENINCYVMDAMSMTRNLSTNSNGRKMFHRYGKTLNQLGFEPPLNIPQIEAMSVELSVPVRDIEFMESVYANKSVSTTDDSIMNLRSDHDHETVEDDLDSVRLMSLIKNKYLHRLSEKEQDIAKRRILTDDAENAKKIADEYGVSTSSIYQLEKRVSQKLISMAQEEMKINIKAA